MQLGLPQAQPAVGKEVVDLRSLRGWESGEHILHVVEGINVQSLASFDQAQDGCRSFSAFLGASEEPVSAAKHHRFHTAFATVIADFDEVVLKVNEKSSPAIESVGDCLAELCLREYRMFCFVEPLFKQVNFRFCEALANVEAFFRAQSCSDALNIEKALDYPHWKLSGDRIFFPGIFEVAMHMGPAIRGCGALFDDSVEFISAICLQNSFVPFENSLRVKRVLRVRVVVADVWLAGIATVNPNVRAVCLAEPLFDHRHCCRVRLNHATVQYASLHSLHNRIEQVTDTLKPSRHGRTINRDVQLLEDLFLPVERKMEPELVCSNFCQESRTSLSFFDWLIWFLRRHHLTAAFLAGVFEHDVLDVFEKRAQELNLVGDLESDNLSCISAAGTEQFIVRKAVFFFSRFHANDRSFASSAMVRFFDNIQTLLLRLQLTAGLHMDSFTAASKKSGVNLGGLLTEQSTIASAELFFQFSNSGKEFFDESMAVSDIVRQIFRCRRIGFRRRSRHDFLPVVHTTILYSNASYVIPLLQLRSGHFRSVGLVVLSVAECCLCFTACQKRAGSRSS